MGRFEKSRKGLSAITLGAGIASFSAIANDYGYEKVFERGVEAYGKSGDILLAISTSGNSENVINAVNSAKKIGIKVIGFLGKNGGKLKDLVDIPIVIPSDNTARIQECHIMFGHIICKIVEERMFGDESGDFS